ncbi:MAG: hypothetical protein K2P76_03830 [Lachnospiraceae bacterium]|nr:hypothetical protein [Lachnospiraceae bacterium]
MNDQIFILILLALTVIATMWLYLLKAKKQIIYKGDERWQMIQLKANQIANIANWILIVFIFGGTIIPFFYNKEITFTLTRVTIFGTYFIGMRNLIELVTIKYLDKRL